MGCAKEKAPYDGGSWKFKSVQYKSMYTNYTRWSLVSYTGDNTPSSSLLVNFYKMIYPGSPIPKAGQYYITRDNDHLDSAHVYIIFTDTSATRFYYPSLYTNAQITVIRNADSTIQVKIPPVMMVSNKDNSDSALLEGTITQTP